MTLEPLLQASPAIQIHAYAAIAAFGLGAVVLFRKKGGRIHRLLGRTWVALMLVVALSSFFIHTIRTWGPWSPIHLLSIGTIISLAAGVAMIRRREIEVHKRIMQSTFAGALVIAGIFTFLPGRIMHEVLFGPAEALAAPASQGESGFMEIIAGTPVWVWPLFGYLLFIGWKRTKDRVVVPWRLFILPAIILALVVHNMPGTVTNAGALAVLVAGVLLGALSGRAIGRRRPAELLADGRLRIAGDWVPLVLMLAIFAVHYAEGVTGALEPSIAGSPAFVLASTFLNGFFASIMLARTLAQLPAGLLRRLPPQAAR